MIAKVTGILTFLGGIGFGFLTLFSIYKEGIDDEGL